MSKNVANTCIHLSVYCRNLQQEKSQVAVFAYMGSCYRLHFEPVSWFQAYVNCKNRRTSLAMMKTKKAINDISVKIKMVHRESVYYWIGLRRFQWNTLAKQGTCILKIKTSKRFLNLFVKYVL